MVQSIDGIPGAVTVSARRRLIAVVVFGVLCLLAATAFAALRHRDGALPAADPAEGRALAASACRHVGEARRAVVANAAADQVFGMLKAATDAARRAVHRDPAWVQLNGGVYAFEQGLRNNDAGAVRLALSVLGPECDRTGAPLEGLPR